jgi:PKD repeat protein
MIPRTGQAAATAACILRPAVALWAVLLGGCFDGGADPPETNIPNTTPVANAGPDQTVFALTTVTLDGSGTTDADGDVLSYSWQFDSRPAGSAAVLANATTAAPTFTADRVGTYVVRLTVDDKFPAGTASDTVSITAATPPPVANAGPDQNLTFAEPGITVQLDGTASSDPLSLPLTYAWAITGFVPASGLPPATPVSLAGASTVNPTFAVEEADQLGVYTLTLTVNNGFLTSSDTLTVAVASIPPPVANAGPDQQVTFAMGSALVQLDGSGSSDPGSLPLGFAWAITDFVPASGTPPAVPAALVGADTVNPTIDVNALDQLGTYTVRLTVTNGTLADQDDVVIEVAKSFPAAAGLLGSAVLAGLGAALGRRWRRVRAPRARPGVAVRGEPRE